MRLFRKNKQLAVLLPAVCVRELGLTAGTSCAAPSPAPPRTTPRPRPPAPALPSVLSSDVKTSDGVRAACIQHSIEDGHSDSRFSLLAREAPRSQAWTDDGLVSAHRGFNQSALAVVGFFLPAQPSMCGNGKNVLVSLRWVVLGLGTEYRCHMGRDNHSNIFSVTSHHIVSRHPIISAVSCYARDSRLYLIQQRRHLRRVSDIVPGHSRGHDH